MYMTSFLQLLIDRGWKAKAVQVNNGWLEVDSLEDIRCYEKMAETATGSRSQSYYEKAFENYQKVYEQFPESGRVGDAVARAANYFYQRQDYQRAIDVFEGVIANHPDANFLDVIHFNYGRCLYRVDRKNAARQQFDLLVADYPESKLAEEAKRISDALVKAGV